MDRLDEIKKATQYLRAKERQRNQQRRNQRKKWILVIFSAIIGLGVGVYAGRHLFL